MIAYKMTVIQELQQLDYRQHFRYRQELYKNINYDRTLVLTFLRMKYGSKVKIILLGQNKISIFMFKYICIFLK